MAEAPGYAAGLISEPQGLPGLLAATRAAYQAHLVETAQARKQLDADVRAVSANAGQDSQRFRPDASVLSRFTEAWAQYGQAGPDPGPAPAPGDLAEAEMMWSTCVKRCEAEIGRYRLERSAWADGRRGLLRKPPSEPRLPRSFELDVRTLHQVNDSYPAVCAAFIHDTESQAVSTLKAAFQAKTSARDKQLTQLIRSNLAAIQMRVDLLGGSGQAWDARLADPLPLPAKPRAVTRLGRISSGLPQPYDIDVPCVISFPSARGLAIEAALKSREQALALLRSVVLRMLMDVPPGQLHLSLIDPTAMGQTFADFTHLGDYDERLIDTGIKTSAHAIERCLTEQLAHLETVISKYLRGQFSNIHDYNRHAGEMTEPYRLIVIADYPGQFSDRAAEYLLSLVENGPRCGIYTLLLYTPDGGQSPDLPFARLAHSMDVVSFPGDTARLRLGADMPDVTFTADACPPIAFDADGRPVTPAAEFIEALGQAAKRTTDTVITVDNFLPVVNRNRAGALPEFSPGAPPLTRAPGSWWTATTAAMAIAPIGRSGAQGVASVYFSFDHRRGRRDHGRPAPLR